MHLVKSCTAALVLSILVSPAAAEEREPNRIVYWGDTSTGASVRVFNTSDAEKKAEAQVKKLGGSGWVLLENSTTPGFGAAICKKVGSGINFYIAHGYASGREAVTAAKAKANGGGSFCSNALWRVAELPAPRESSVMDVAKGLVRKAVTNDDKEPDSDKACRPGSAPSGPEPSPSATKSKKPTEKCPESKDGSFRTNYSCMCVRG